MLGFSYEAQSSSRAAARPDSLCGHLECPCSVESLGTYIALFLEELGMGLGKCFLGTLCVLD